MKIVFLVNLDWHSCLALNLLLPRLKDDDLSIVATSKVGKPDQAAAALDMLKFAERDFPFQFLANYDGSGEIVSMPTLARRLQCPFRIIENVNLGRHRRWLADWAPDLTISVRHGRILKEKALAIPKLGTLNLHSGLLPEYRGVMASFHALRAGERVLGTTLHYISDATIDTGPIVAMTHLPVTPGLSYFRHVEALYPDGCAQILKAVESLRDGQPLTVSQQSGGQYFSHPSDADVADLDAKGFRLVTRADLHHIARMMGADC